MTAAQVICNAINLRSKCFKATCLFNDKINVKYFLVVNKHVNDKEIIEANPEWCIRYNSNAKNGKSRFIVDKTNVNNDYPNVSNNKSIVVTRVYEMSQILRPDIHLHEFFYNERNLIFRELKANMKLEEIGELTKEWEAINDGKIFIHKKHLLGYGVKRNLSRSNIMGIAGSWSSVQHLVVPNPNTYISGNNANTTQTF